MKQYFIHFLLLSLFNKSISLLARTSSNEKCPIESYKFSKGSPFIGKKIYANVETFHPLLDIISKYASECHINLRVKQAFIRENTTKAEKIADDNIRLAFELGEAIQYTIIKNHNKKECGEHCEKKFESRKIHVSGQRCFSRQLGKQPNLRHDRIKRIILLKYKDLKRSLIKLDKRRKQLQKQCKTLKLH